MVDPSLIISIDRTTLSLPPLVFDASPGADLGITDYQEPALQPRIAYAPTSDFLHGELAMSWAYQQTLLNFSFFAPEATTETAARALAAEVAAALTQSIEFEVTVTTSDAPAETWTCNPGSLAPEGSRTLVNLKHVCPVWSVSIPCYPIRSVA